MRVEGGSGPLAGSGIINGERAGAGARTGEGEERFGADDRGRAGYIAGPCRSRPLTGGGIVDVNDLAGIEQGFAAHDGGPRSAALREAGNGPLARGGIVDIDDIGFDRVLERA